jgi:hypothetical protein
VNTITDAEIGAYWDRAEVEERVALLTRAKFNSPKYRGTYYFQWVALLPKTKERLRKVIISGNPVFDNHGTIVNSGAVATVAVRKVGQVVKASDSVSIGGRRTHRRFDSPPGKQRRVFSTPAHQPSVGIEDEEEEALIVDPSTNCTSCGILWGADGEDTLEFSKTQVCERCMKEKMTGKMSNNWDGGEVYTRSSPVYDLGMTRPAKDQYIKRKTKHER